MSLSYFKEKLVLSHFLRQREEPIAFCDVLKCHGNELSETASCEMLDVILKVHTHSPDKIQQSDLCVKGCGKKMFYVASHLHLHTDPILSQ